MMRLICRATNLTQPHLWPERVRIFILKKYYKNSLSFILNLMCANSGSEEELQTNPDVRLAPSPDQHNKMN